jgi:ankyrin repeat protein
MSSLDEELIDAARENNLPEVERLLSDGADIEAKGYDGWTPLHWASAEEHSQVCQALREHGADIEARDIIGRTPLHIVAMEGQLAVVNELLSPNDSNGTTSILGKRKRQRQGANVETKDNNGDTPLHSASIFGHLPVVKALLSAGADILAADNAGRLPIHRAVAMGQGNSEVAKFLLHQLYATTRRLPLHELLQDLTFDGNPNCRDYPPLCTALIQDVLGMDDVAEIIEYLVGQNPALISSRDRESLLPLHVACRRVASFAIVQSLVNLYKASVKSVTSEGDLPLFLACEMPGTSLDTLFLLMKLYPDVVYHR